jgi:predicted nucleic acid-binding protein
MPNRPVALYDANVLYPAQLRDFLMRLALADVVRAHWTEQIHDEWMRNVHARYPDVSWDDLRRIRQLMDEALPSALVSGFEDRISDLSLSDASDRHVLAAAIHVGADYIITFNTRDFPESSLAPHRVEATDPDDFVSGLFERSPQAVVDVAARHRGSLTQPPKTPEEYLDLLRSSRLDETARRIETRLDQL